MLSWVELVVWVGVSVLMFYSPHCPLQQDLVTLGCQYLAIEFNSIVCLLL